ASSKKSSPWPAAKKPGVNWPESATKNSRPGSWDRHFNRSVYARQRPLLDRFPDLGCGRYGTFCLWKETTVDGAPVWRTARDRRFVLYRLSALHVPRRARPHCGRVLAQATGLLSAASSSARLAGLFASQKANQQTER